MKEQYEAPKTEVILLEEKDILLASPGDATLTSYRDAADANPEGSGMSF